MLKSLRENHASNTVVALYGLTCNPRGEGRCEFKAGQSFFWEKKLLAPMLSWLTCKRALRKRWPHRQASSPRSGNLLKQDATLQKKTPCSLFADGLQLFYGRHAVMMLHSLLVKRGKGSTMCIKLTTATSPLPARETKCLPRTMSASG